MKAIVLAALAAAAFVAGPSLANAYEGHGSGLERHHKVCYFRHHHRVCHWR